MATQDITTARLQVVLEKIADTAANVSELCCDAICNTSTDSPEDINRCAELINTARSLVNQMGYLADLHSGGAMKGGDPVAWLLPGTHHDNSQSAD